MGTRLKAIGVVAMVASVATASCSASDRPSPAPSAEAPVRGGTLVVGATQEPGCADWYAPCGNNSWGGDMMSSQTLPRTFDFVDGQYRPNVLLAGEPTVEPGPPQRVTYRLAARAVWSDGQPITSADLQYTVEQGKAAALPSLLAITAVDDSDPRTAVVTYASPEAAWRDGFGTCQAL